jgi:polar amino acid transport system ATP-binding protein
MVIKTVGLTKRFGSDGVGVQALRGVDLSVQDGEFLAVMGPSGSGKSTLLSILGCLERPTSGEYRLSGEDVARFDERKAARVRRERIGFVFQGFNLLPRATALANVELPLVYAHVPRPERHQRAVDALEAVGLRERAGHWPTQLSGGQQQRVAIARGLCMRPKIMLFDEPTSALDPEMINEVLDVMVELAQEGMTMMVVTHEMGFARKVAHRVIFMDGGRIVEDAAKDEFFGTPRSERAQLFLSKILHH